MIKRLLLPLCILFIQLSTVYMSASEPIGTLTLSQGSVKLQRSQHVNWKQIAIGDFIYQGDRVRTAVASKAEVLFHDGSVVFIGEDTEIEFIDEKSEKKNSIFIFFGSMWNQVAKGNHYEVESIHALATVKGTYFHSHVEESVMEIFTKEGLVEIANEHGIVLAEANTVTTVSKDTAPNTETIDDDDYPDEISVNQSYYFDMSVPSSMHQEQWHKVSLLLRDSDKDELQTDFDDTVSLSSDEGLFLSLDKDNLSQSLELSLKDGQADLYIFSERESANLTISSALISTATEPLTFKSAKKKDYVLIQFSDEHGNKRQIQANYKKK